MGTAGSESVGVGDGAGIGVDVRVGGEVGVGAGAIVGIAVGVAVGTDKGVGVGRNVGAGVGVEVGASAGVAVTMTVGEGGGGCVGAVVGVGTGVRLGVGVGVTVGGIREGLTVGGGVRVGNGVRVGVGRVDGASPVVSSKLSDTVCAVFSSPRNPVLTIAKANIEAIMRNARRPIATSRSVMPRWSLPNLINSCNSLTPGRGDYGALGPCASTTLFKTLDAAVAASTRISQFRITV